LIGLNVKLCPRGEVLDKGVVIGLVVGGIRDRYGDVTGDIDPVDVI
jgi:hypothetical protein